MSLTRTNLAKTIKKQYFFKLKANITSFTLLIGVQLLALLFSLGGVASSSFGSSSIRLNTQYYTADIVIIFTLIWAFVMAITITTKPHRDLDFTFVTNRLSSSFANILYLLTVSIVGSMMAILSDNLLRVIIYTFLDKQFYSSTMGLQEFIMGISITSFYVLMVCSIGYFVGTLVQISSLFTILLPALFFGSLFLRPSMDEKPIITNAFEYYLLESSLTLFIVKIVITTALFFTISTSILNRMEVRQ
ncbi:hypothetical protein [Chengkuizengella marina]|uniref:ABC-2 family transporter protein n=1 Tax=Chengkuizengella marina TaxID=2507566 RepID=A0A6N9Q237_9BACL|nr:hypothetical protein [Chengkuizengella marina]NBI28550.1 hypothetical protein [Chengkuizengella marina]